MTINFWYKNYIHLFTSFHGIVYGNLYIIIFSLINDKSCGALQISFATELRLIIINYR